MKTPTQSHVPANKVLREALFLNNEGGSRHEAAIEANQFLKGQCLECGEVFNLRFRSVANDRDWLNRDLCPDCGEIFEPERN